MSQQNSTLLLNLNSAVASEALIEQQVAHRRTIRTKAQLCNLKFPNDERPSIHGDMFLRFNQHNLIFKIRFNI